MSFRTGGIIPPVAQQLHRENIQRIVQEALSASEVSPSELSAIATPIKTGLALSLGVGLSFSLQLVDQFKKPFIPIHHMEAHALTIRLTNKVEFSVNFIKIKVQTDQFNPSLYYLKDREESGRGPKLTFTICST